MSLLDTSSPPRPTVALHRHAALAAILLVPSVLLVLSGLPIGHSYSVNLPWLIAFEAALADGAWIPRHLPLLWDGAGGLDFFFYGPVPFYLAAGPARWLCPGCESASLLALTGGMLLSLSGLSFLALARRFLPPVPALAAVLAYMLMPYHLWTDWFIRQALTEFAAFVFLPLAVAGTVDVMRGGRPGWPLVVGWAGTALCHLPVAMLFGHVLMVPVLAHALIHRAGAVRRLAWFAAGTAAGLLLAGAYWVPAVLLLGDVSPDALYSGLLFEATAWLLPLGGAAPEPQTGIVIQAALYGTLALGGLAALVARGTASGEARLWILGLAVPSGVLMTVLSTPLWEHWILDRAQFPYRLLAVADLAGALAVGALVAAWRGSAGTVRLLVVLGLGWHAAVSAVVAANAIPYAVLANQDRELRLYLMGTAEYLPPVARGALARIADEPGATGTRLDLLVATREALAENDLRHESSPRRLTATLPDAAGGSVRLPMFHWEHWRAAAPDGTAIPLRAEPELGFAVADVPPGVDRIEVVLPILRAEWAGLGASLAGLLLWLGLAWTGRRRASPARQ